MQTTFLAEFDRYLVEIPCDRCDRIATWTIRFRYRGGRAIERHTCNVHRRSTAELAMRPHPSSGEPLEFERIARTAF